MDLPILPWVAALGGSKPSILPMGGLLCVYLKVFRAAEGSGFRARVITLLRRSGRSLPVGSPGQSQNPDPKAEKAL